MLASKVPVVAAASHASLLAGGLRGELLNLQLPPITSNDMVPSNYSQPSSCRSDSCDSSSDHSHSQRLEYMPDYAADKVPSTCQKGRTICLAHSQWYGSNDASHQEAACRHICLVLPSVYTTCGHAGNRMPSATGKAAAFCRLRTGVHRHIYTPQMSKTGVRCLQACSSLCHRCGSVTTL